MEIMQYSAPEGTNKYAEIESKAASVVASAISLLDMINESFDPDEAEELTRRFFQSIKFSDYSKFERKIQTLEERSTNKND